MDKVWRGFQMVTAHETAHDFRYDWITRLRPDTYFEPVPRALVLHARQPPAAGAPVRAPINFEADGEGRAYEEQGPWSRTVFDGFAIVPRARAESFFSARQAIDMCVPLADVWSACPNAWLPTDLIAPRESFPSGQPTDADLPMAFDERATKPADWHEAVEWMRPQVNNPLFRGAARGRFFAKIGANASNWPFLSTQQYPECVLTAWLRQAHVPLLGLDELRETFVWASSADGSQPTDAITRLMV